jgi:hypothetical protein
LDDEEFNNKIFLKKEFNNTSYDELTKEEFEDIENISQRKCNRNMFQLSPHQLFVKNFLSFDTPYNSLLLYHGLGTGKTCSSILVAEEMRYFLKQMNIKKKIIIVASPVVQENYKIQLFDERKLVKKGDQWDIQSCTGNSFIKEINPINSKISKEKLILLIKKIIKRSYEFMGYIEFSNKITTLYNKYKINDTNNKISFKRKSRLINKEFSRKLIIIDEVQNIRNLKKLKASSENFLELVKYAENLKLMLLTATPMYNNPQEIIWLLNLMNLNDNRAPLEIKDVFKDDGELLVGNNNEQIGKEILERKMRGYVSYVRGDDPFSFPNAIYPSDYDSPYSIKIKLANQEWAYPTIQLNSATITEEMQIKFLDIFIVNVGIEQNKMYNYLMKNLKIKFPILTNKNKGIQFKVLDGPMQILNMSYPHPDFPKDGEIVGDIYKELYGRNGLFRVMEYDENRKNNFEYIGDERLFSKENLIKYSGKISVIMDHVVNSEGIILIYSQYIDGGCIPLALALEELGFTRYGDKSSLFKEAPVNQLMLGDSTKYPAKYIMITGDPAISGRNKKELKACTDPKNINGEVVKIVIISKAGSEGLDFKNIRQVHILEPWYNFNRTSQTIGRAIRNLSHCNLNFNKRNTQIFLYGTELFNDGYIQDHETLESVDLYIYRLAERKGIKIGKINKILKKNAVDCLLNVNQTQMSVKDTYGKSVSQILSTGDEINIILGDKDSSVQCDFDKCNFQCNSVNIGEIEKHTFNDTFLNINNDIITTKIKELFKDQYLYRKSELIKKIRTTKQYEKEEINAAINSMIDNNDYLVDKLNRIGKLKNIDEYYLFHPIDINETMALTNYKMRQPAPHKLKKNVINISKDDKLLQIVNSENTLNNAKDQILYILDIKTTLDRKFGWTKASKIVLNEMSEISFFNEDIIKEFIIFHIFDLLNYKEKKILLEFYHSKERMRDDEVFYKFTEKYFNNKSIEYNNEKIFILRNDNDVLYKFKILKYNIETNMVDEIKMNAAILKKIKEKYSIDETNINNIFGFLSKFKDSNRYVFKIKLLLNKKNNTGRKCGGNKTELIKFVNKLYSLFFQIIKKEPENRYLKDETGKFNKINNFIDIKNIIKLDPVKLCVEIEMLFSYLDYEYNNRNENIKKFYFTAIEEVLYNLKKIPNDIKTPFLN